MESLGPYRCLSKECFMRPSGIHLLIAHRIGNAMHPNRMNAAIGFKINAKIHESIVYPCGSGHLA